MLVLLLATALALRAGAIPVSTGPTTAPTLVHTMIFGLTTRNGCSDIRSMYDIVRSCFLTIGACVYRAIHPNIPDPNASWWKKIRVTVKIAISALIAPELMIFWAIRQRIGAKIVAEEMNELRPELKWTQTHGQFAQMGGFGRKDTQHILYPESLVTHLANNQIDVEDLKLTEKEINDKSKGDILSKGIVAFQTTWFVFECIARLQQGLPIIELEVVTLAFATLNAITYGLWWYKPLNVTCPIYIRVQVTSSNPPIDTPVPVVKHEEEPLIGGGQSDGIGSGKAKTVKEKMRGFGTGIGDAVKGVIGDFKQDLRYRGRWKTTWHWLIQRPFLAVSRPFWDLLCDEEANYQTTHVSTFYGKKIPEERHDAVILWSSFIGIIFGAIHFISWDSTFPTRIQLLLWRTSSVVMIVQPFLLGLTDIVSHAEANAPPRSIRAKVASILLQFFAILSFFAGTIPYILARFCVLVLAFLTLRDLPLGAFTNVSWTAYIPHW